MKVLKNTTLHVGTQTAFYVLIALWVFALGWISAVTWFTAMCPMGV